ncbi:MAG: adenine phosphoribosyltransferase [Kiritimatiellae bacterium]|nr:adenine phosphoribosyltransferase [Kiritimatiellia bacterium]MBR1837366.1 adenine phosphoribosyltransferase [Kiritimatiellia bacterium]
MKPLRDYIHLIPDFPGPGVLFRDITGILDSGAGFRLCCDELCERLKGVDFDLVAGIESRGFLFGAPIADRFRKAFVPVRKKGKLPRKTISETYTLEYGEATIEMHDDAVKPGQKVVLVDDLLATGGTMAAACNLVERLGGEVAKVLFVVELEGFGARETKLAGRPVETLLRYEGK